MAHADGKGVEAVDRAMALLGCFDGAEALSLADLARRSGMYKSTVLRLAASLQRAQMLTRGEDGRFRLGPALWRLGSLYRRRFDIEAIVRPALEALARETGETASFYVLDGDARVCLYREDGPRAIRHHVAEGVRLPLTAGATARVLAAYSGASGVAAEAVRTAGGAVSIGERDPEVAAVAAPVFGAGGILRGALSTSGPASRFDPGAALTATVAAAAALSARLAAEGA